MFNKIKTAASTAVLTIAAIQAARGWYELGLETVEVVKERRNRR